MEKLLLDEIADLIDELEEMSDHGKKPVEIGFQINVAIVNVMWAILSGERRSHNDPVLIGKKEHALKIYDQFSL